MARDRFANRGDHVAGRARGHDVPVTDFEQRPVGAYAAPLPPPVDMPVDPVKWAALTRQKRRELIRYHRKQARGK